MNSALCLHYGALHIPSTINRSARVARPYSSFRPPFLSLSSKASTHCALPRHAFSSPVICALNRPSTPSPNHDKDNGKKIVRVVGGASVVLACVLGIINFRYTCNARAGMKPDPGVTTEATVFPRTAKDVLDSFFMVNKVEGIPRSKLKKMFSSAKLPLSAEPSIKECEDFLQVAEIINLAACEKAEERLREVLRNIMSKQKPNEYPETAFNVEMALVVVLLFQGKYIDASKFRCLQDGYAIPSDPRIKFYKAIIYTMMGRKEVDKAKRCWQEVITTIDDPFESPFPKEHMR